MTLAFLEDGNQPTSDTMTIRSSSSDFSSYIFSTTSPGQYSVALTPGETYYLFCAVQNSRNYPYQLKVNSGSYSAGTAVTNGTVTWVRHKFVATDPLTLTVKFINNSKVVENDSEDKLD